MENESDFLPLSALQHILFCERQCALIHIERAWEENILTIEGKQMHEKIDNTSGESRKDIRTAYSLPISSHQLKLIGKADVVEFHQTNADDPDGIKFSRGQGLPSALQKGRWKPYPVEYKHGKPKLERCDEVQLCAQAVCLEEMCKVSVPQGALFYGKTCHRYEVSFDASLREQTEKTAQLLHNLFNAGIFPQASYQKKCEKCSLLEICMPKSSNGKKSARAYVEKILTPQD